MGELHKVKFDSKKDRMKKNALSFNIQALSLPAVDTTDIFAISKRVEEYLNGCAERDIKPGVQGVCLWLGIDRQTWYNWCSGKSRRETHYNYCNRVMVLLAANWENNMQDNKTNAVSGIFIGKNDYGYKDKSEVAVEPKKTVTTETNMNDVMALIEEPKPKEYIEATYAEVKDNPDDSL